MGNTAITTPNQVTYCQVQESQPVVEQTKNMTIEDIEKLEKLADLKSKNIITEEEFESKKKEILGL